LKDYGLRNQVRKAADSIPSSITEGDELGTDKHSIRYFHTSKGSSAEVLTQAIISIEIGYLQKKNFLHIEKECQRVFQTS
jgi:four helix bundle protein